MRSLPVLILLMTAHAFAQTGAPAPQSPPSIAMPPAAAATPQAIARAQKVLAKAKATYTAVTTYQDHTDSSFAPVTEDGDAKTVQNHTATVRFKRPELCLVQGDTFAFSCDGTVFTTYQGEYKQYITSPLNGTLSESLAQIQDSVQIPPVVRILAAGGSVPDTLVTGVTRILGSAQEELDGRKGTSVFMLMLSDFRDPASLPVPLVAWFDETTGLLGRTILDLGPAYNLMARQLEEEQKDDQSGFHGPTKFKSALWTSTFTDIKIDAELGNESLAYVPPEGSEKANTFHKTDPGPAAQREMLKNAAPAFSVNDCDGKTIALADLKGRVVVLDFWATWCGPCVAAMPQMQALADKFEGKPVTILGVNQDRDKSAADIKAFLDSKKITLRQALDPTNSIGGNYNVTAIPCVAFIDKEGKVQDVVVGYSSGHGSEFELRINNLLEGKPIHEGSEIAEQAAADDPDTMGGGTFPLVDDNSPEALALKPVGTAAGTPIISILARMIDVDGDGKPELVAPLDRTEPPAGLAIFNADGTIQKRLPLDQAANGTVAGFDFALGQWSVVHQTNSSSGLGRVSIVGYDPTGKKLWRYRVETSSDRAASAKLVIGDLTGEGKSETAVLVTSYIINKSGASQTSYSDMRSTLLVLSSTGDPLAFRRIGQNASSVSVVPPASKSEHASILVSADGRLLRFAFDASKSLNKTPENK